MYPQGPFIPIVDPKPLYLLAILGSKVAIFEPFWAPGSYMDRLGK